MIKNKKIIFYSKLQKEMYLKIKHSYLCVRIKKYRWSFLLSIERYWSGLNTLKNTEKHKRIAIIRFLCFEFEINSYGQLVREKNWPSKWI